MTISFHGVESSISGGGGEKIRAHYLGVLFFLYQILNFVYS